MGLGLLFLLAGYFVPPAYDRKGSRRFLRERWSRLGVPLVAFVFAVNLPLTLAYEQPHSFGDFLGSLYHDALTPLYMHLWFLGHLMLYSAAYVVWRRFAGGAPHFWGVPGHHSILAFTVGLIAVTWVVRWWYPVDEWVPLLWVLPAEPAHLPQYVSLCALGVMANRGDCAASVTGDLPVGPYGWAA